MKDCVRTSILCSLQQRRLEGNIKYFQIDELPLDAPHPTITFYMMADHSAYAMPWFDESQPQPIRCGSKVYILKQMTDEPHSMTITAVFRDDEMNNYVATSYHGYDQLHLGRRNGRYFTNNGTEFGDGVVAICRNPIIANGSSCSENDQNVHIPKTDLFLIKVRQNVDNVIQGVPLSSQSAEAVIQGYLDVKHPHQVPLQVQYWGGVSGHQKGRIYRTNAWFEGLPQGAVLVAIDGKQGDSGALITTIPDGSPCQSGSTMIPPNAFTFAPRYSPMNTTLNIQMRENLPRAQPTMKSCLAISCVVGEYSFRRINPGQKIMLTLPVEPAIEDFQIELGRRLHFHKPCRDYPQVVRTEVFV